LSKHGLLELTCLLGGTRDYIIVGSDSGRLTILDYNAEHNRFANCVIDGAMLLILYDRFDKVHEETYGRTGMRRVVPGQYLTTDPKGRALMIGAIEKSKFVYILNRDSAAKLTISSPLEAHKAHAITFDLVGVDVGFDNPLFAAIEVLLPSLYIYIHSLLFSTLGRL
jgi:splicing factor 3B subunit 3